MWSLHNKCNVCSECCICHVEFKVCLVSKCFEKNVTTINCFLFQVWNWCWWWWKFFVFKFKTSNLTEQITSWGDYDAQCLYGVVSDLYLLSSAKIWVCVLGKFWQYLNLASVVRILLIFKCQLTVVQYIFMLIWGKVKTFLLWQGCFAQAKRGFN